MTDLSAGPLSPLLKAVRHHDLDLQIREEYVNLYYRGLSALKVTRIPRSGDYRAQIHVKYLSGVELPGERRRNAAYMEFDVGAAFVNAYVQRLPALCANADNYRSPERDAEQRLVRNSLTPDSPLVGLDRQVQVRGLLRRADVIGITRESGPRLILGEIKAGLNNDIQSLPEQLRPYYAVLADGDGRLKVELAGAYRNVVAQKQRLGVLHPDVVFPSRSPRVECLVILCDYNNRSKLLDRARATAKHCGLIIWVVKPGPDYRIPDISNWERLNP